MTTIPPGPAGVAHAVLALGVEIAVLVAAVRAALRVTGGGWTGWVLGLVLVAVVIWLWSRWGAPNSGSRLAGTPLLLFKIAVFAFGAAWFLMADGLLVAAIFVAVVVVHLALALSLDAL